MLAAARKYLSSFDSLQYIVVFARQAFCYIFPHGRFNTEWKVFINSLVVPRYEHKNIKNLLTNIREHSVWDSARSYAVIEENVSDVCQCYLSCRYLSGQYSIPVCYDDDKLAICFGPR